MVRSSPSSITVKPARSTALRISSFVDTAVTAEPTSVSVAATIPPIEPAPITRIRGCGFIASPITRIGPRKLGHEKRCVRWEHRGEGIEFHQAMQISCWGVRGSYPVPGAATVRYGGQTSCVEARSAAGDTVIVDAGTGLRALGRKLAREAAGVPRHHHVL